MSLSGAYNAGSGPRRLLVAASSAAAAIAFSSEVFAEASPKAVDALVHDLEKIIENQTSLGWKIDKYDFDKMMPDALLSVCRSTDEARLAALGELDERINDLGGPLEEAYRSRGKSLKGLGELVFVTRIHDLLEEASQRASGECPLGMEPEPDFRGLQTDAYRFTISVEGGGLFMLQRPKGEAYQFGGGGSGRLLLGRGLNQHWTVLAGVELGGAAIIAQTDTTTNFPLQFTGAIPVVLRRHWVTWHFDFEAAPLGFFTASDLALRPGARFGFLIGISTLRIRRIMPWAGLGIAGEYVFRAPDHKPLSIAKGGLRVGFDWDF